MLNNILSFAGLTRRSDEDLCSQFNYLWSAIVLAAMGGFVTLVQYAGTPIACWCPAEMPEFQCNYTRALCWVKQNNYYVHEDEDIIPNQEGHYSESIAYYPWVPWILFFMACLVKLPHYIWHSFAHSSGLNLVKLVELADSHEDIENLARILRLWLVRTGIPRSSKCSSVKYFLGSIGFFWLGKQHKTYLAGLVLFIKFTYLLVALAMHYSLNVFIDEDFMWYGFEIFENYLRGVPQFSARFPAQTLCDMEIRQFAIVHRYTIQCILPINRFSEKIFIFVWFWLLLLIILNAWSLFKWSIRLLSPAERLRFVQAYVEITLHLIERQKLGSKPTEDAHYDTVYNHSVFTYPNVNISVSSLSTVKASDGSLKTRKRIQSTLHELFSQGSRPRQNFRIEASEKEAEEFELQEKLYAMEERRQKKIIRITKRIMKRFGHDGVVVFRTLEDAVGVIMANQIFQELYEQLNSSLHYS
ncbi:innexin unc-9-like [Biomphalaria glabrata]|uniref:Innexin n=1 Tax=Biomphalaria glabrata TaxID=6526 RepID=A0A9W2Z4D1_BIOGL|nr:innexin unc-9-like [Biomphalaria glabrata]XP_055869769.1 innexin unc-9-like [Biomphalaria glabrata]XP_055869770.1 innexin unc-9-like [Biomphalaria glabrata]